jgi:hypothetical protein
MMTLAEFSTCAAAVLGLVLFRSLPVALYAAVCRSARISVRVGGPAAWAGLALAVIALGAPLEETRAMAAAVPYFALCTALVHRFGRRAIAAAGGAAVFVVLALMFVVAPAAVLRFGGSSAIVVAGWGMMLAAYSYAVDAPAGDRLGQALFFVLVNPALVHPERGERAEEPRLSAEALLRILLGVSAIVARMVLLAGIARAPQLRFADRDPSVWTTYCRFVLSEGRLAIALYLAHSGLASIQIGLLRLLGYRLPERYRLPFLAASPQDFWRRWNVWVSSWGRRYVFRPASAVLRRGPLRRVAPELATLIVFAAIGLLHDLGVGAVRWPVRGAGGLSLSFTGLFIGFGLALLAWRSVEQRLGKALTPGRFPRWAGALVSWAVFVHVALFMAEKAVPILGGPS